MPNVLSEPVGLKLLSVPSMRVIPKKLRVATIVERVVPENSVTRDVLI